MSSSFDVTTRSKATRNMGIEAAIIVRVGSKKDQKQSGQAVSNSPTPVS